MELFDFDTWFSNDDPERWQRFWWIFGIGFFGLAAFVVLLWWILFSDSESSGESARHRGEEGDSSQDSKDEGWPRIPTEAEIGERAGQLSRWRSEAEIVASQDDDWILGERELYRQACRLNKMTDRTAAYQEGLGREEIEGVDSWEADELGRLGYPSSKAIAGMSDGEQAKVENWFRRRGRSVDIGALRSAAKDQPAEDKEGERGIEEPEPGMPSDVDYVGLEKNYEGEENLHVASRLGLVFTGPANCEDDLTKIKGIGKEISKTLNDNGVFRFQQIADWNEYNVWAFNRIIAFPGRIQRDEWIRQAKELAPESRCLSPGKARVRGEDLGEIISEEFSGEDVEIREPFGIVYQSAPAEPDNLQEIRGVGPVLEKKLHEFGVYRFKQIANWPEEAIDEFQEQLSFPDRIRRDNWVGQCEELAFRK